MRKNVLGIIDLIAEWAETRLRNLGENDLTRHNRVEFYRAHGSFGGDFFAKTVFASVADLQAVNLLVANAVKLAFRDKKAIINLEQVMATLHVTVPGLGRVQVFIDNAKLISWYQL